MRSFITPGKVILSGLILLGLLFTAILVLAMDSRVWVPPGDGFTLKRTVKPKEENSQINTTSESQMQPAMSPTPDAVRELPALRKEEEQ